MKNFFLTKGTDIHAIIFIIDIMIIVVLWTVLAYQKIPENIFENQ